MDNKSLSFSIWKKMIPFFRPYYKYFFTTISLNVLLVAVDVLVPLFQSYAIDHFIIVDTLEGIRPFACLYAAVIMFLLNWKLAAIIMLIVPLIAVLMAVFQTKMLFWNRKVREINFVRPDLLSGEYRTGCAFARTGAECDRSSGCY